MLIKWCARPIHIAKDVWNLFSQDMSVRKWLCVCECFSRFQKIDVSCDFWKYIRVFGNWLHIYIIKIKRQLKKVELKSNVWNIEKKLAIIIPRLFRQDIANLEKILIFNTFCNYLHLRHFFFFFFFSFAPL